MKKVLFIVISQIIIISMFFLTLHIVGLSDSPSYKLDPTVLKDQQQRFGKFKYPPQDELRDDLRDFGPIEYILIPLYEESLYELLRDYLWVSV